MHSRLYTKGLMCSSQDTRPPSIYPYSRLAVVYYGLVTFRLCLYSCYPCQAALYSRISPIGLNRLVCDLLKLPAKHEGHDAEVPCEICWPVLHRLAEQIIRRGIETCESSCQWGDLCMRTWCKWLENLPRGRAAKELHWKNRQWDGNSLL